MSGINALMQVIRAAQPSSPGLMLVVGEVRQAVPLVVEYGGLELEATDLTVPDTLELAGPLAPGDEVLMVTENGQVFHILHRIFHTEGAKM